MKATLGSVFRRNANDDSVSARRRYSSPANDAQPIYKTAQSHRRISEPSNSLSKVPQLPNNSTLVNNELLAPPSSSSSHQTQSPNKNPMSNVTGTGSRSKRSRHNKLTTESSGLLHSDCLAEYLSERGFLPPKFVHMQNDLVISVASTGDSVFLPCQKSRRRRRTTDRSVPPNGNNTITNPESQNPTSGGLTNDIGINTENEEQSNYVESHDDGWTENVLTSDGRESDPSSGEKKNNMTPYSIAFILTVKEPTIMKKLRVDLLSMVDIFWFSHVPPDLPQTSHRKEVYCLGNIGWTLSSSNYDVFIPLNLKSKNEIVENVPKYKRKIETLELKKSTKAKYYNESKTKAYLFNYIQGTSKQTLSPGDYIFICPILFKNSIPASACYPTGEIKYNLRFASSFLSSHNGEITRQNSLESLIDKAGNKIKPNKLLKINKASPSIGAPIVSVERSDRAYDLYFEYPLNIIRMPPDYFPSDLNRPLFGSKTWNNCLYYEISFAQRFIPINTQVPMELTLVPISKNISVKLIRISVIENIEYHSKNNEVQQNQVDIISTPTYRSQYEMYTKMSERKRKLSLIEIRGKSYGSPAIREEYITNCVSDNLLSYSSVSDMGPDGEQIEIPISEPIHIKTTLKFPRAFSDMEDRSMRAYPPYGIEQYTCINDIKNVGTANQAESHNTSNRDTNSRRPSLHSIIPTLSSNSQKSQNTRSMVENDSQKTCISTKGGNIVEHEAKISTPHRGLYIDSSCFKNIRCTHTLEIRIRINRLFTESSTAQRFQDIVFESPITLVAEECSTANTVLPSYDMAMKDKLTNDELPSFKEAIDLSPMLMKSPRLSPQSSSDSRHGRTQTSPQTYKIANLDDSTAVNGALAPVGHELITHEALNESSSPKMKMNVSQSPLLYPVDAGSKNEYILDSRHAMLPEQICLIDSSKDNSSSATLLYNNKITKNQSNSGYAHVFNLVEPPKYEEIS